MTDCHVHLERGPYNLEWLQKFIDQGQKVGVSRIYFLEHTHRFHEFLPLYARMSQYNSYQRNWIEQKGKHSIYEYIHLIEYAKKQKYPLDIRFGLEVCYDESMEQFIEFIKNFYTWDFLTGAIHWVDGFAYDHRKEFWIGKDINTIYSKYYDLVAKLIKSNLFTGLAHPDAIKCFNYYPDLPLKDAYYKIAQLLNKYNMYAEDSCGLHNNYLHEDWGLGDEIRNIFIENKVSILTASDAHKPEDVGRGLSILNKILGEK